MIKKYSALKSQPSERAVAFFLPLETRPKEFAPLSNIKNFWHTGIIFEGRVYECFNSGKHRISEESERMPEFTKQKAKFVKTLIDSDKLKSELTSGTSCDEFVLRATGHSNLTGDNKGTRYPEDVKKILESDFVK